MTNISGESLNNTFAITTNAALISVWRKIVKSHGQQIRLALDRSALNQWLADYIIGIFVKLLE